MSSRRTLKALLAALVITLAVAFAALVAALLMSVSGSGDVGIGAYAGGVSGRFVRLLAPASPLFFAAAFLLLRRSFR